ncbi:MAG TPA: peptidase, partial [Gemmataceae bacterium]|nr:peptidase [Gemmataceae bacterium]
SYVVKCAQAFRAHVLDLFEPQDYPNDFAYPGAPPTPPYDSAGWTLAYQMGIRFDRILDSSLEAARVGSFEEIQGPLPPPPGQVTAGEKAAGFFLETNMNDAFHAVNRLLKAGVEVRRLQQPFVAHGEKYAAGTFFIPSKGRVRAQLEKIAAELGTPFRGSLVAPGKEAATLKPVRVGLWDRYGGSMPSGWTRWLLERFEFPFQVVFPPELDRGNLREKFDVIILVDGAITPPGGKKVGVGGAIDEQSIPEEYRGRAGNITREKTVPRLREFLDNGGTILTIGSSTDLARQLGLPVANHLVTTKDGVAKPLPREQYYVPGSVLRVRVDPSHPLAWGLGDEVDVLFANSPTFRLADNAGPNELRRVAWFDSKTPLRSGWAWGQEHLQGGVAIAEASVGKGRLVLFGPQVLFRAQPHGTFRFVFNGIVQAGAKQ